MEFTIDEFFYFVEWNSTLLHFSIDNKVIMKIKIKLIESRIGGQLGVFTCISKLKEL